MKEHIKREVYVMAKIKGQSIIYLSHLKDRWRRLWKDEEAKFRIATALKMTAIPFMSFIIMSALFWLLLKMNFSFFKANEFRGIEAFEEVFFHFINQALLEVIPYAALLMVFVNLTAIYVSDILLRPFRLIGEYCEGRNNSKDVSYNPDFFTDLKLLSQFSEYFFSCMETAEKNNKLGLVVVPKKYVKIHKPVFEATFFLHYALFILASLLAVSIALYAFGNGLHSNLIVLAEQTLPNNPAINYYLSQQKETIDVMITFVLVISTFLYMGLASHLYYKVAAPSFAIFATMRAFLKGNHDQRVHLIGFSYLRNQTRKLNKYLDWVQKSLVTDIVVESTDEE